MFVSTGNQPGLTEDPVRGREEGVLRALRKIMRAVDMHSRRLVATAQLTGPQLLCLRELMRSGPLVSGRLAAQLCLSPATVTGILDRLEARGLASRQRDSRDRRKVTIRLTRAGKKIVLAAPEPLQDSFLTGFRAMSTAEQSQMLDTLQQIVSMMDAQVLISVPETFSDLPGSGPIPNQPRS